MLDGNGLDIQMLQKYSIITYYHYQTEQKLFFFFDRQLRALASLLTFPPEELAKQSAEPGGPVSTYVVLFLLFGHAGPDLTSPHVAAGWSNEKLLQWLDGHTSDRERYFACYKNWKISETVLFFPIYSLELINGALQKYRTIVRQKNIAQYDPIYPFISNYLEKVYAELRI